jgi:cardiolipin synthase A/B
VDVQLPRARNIVIAVAVVLGVIGAGLVIAQDQETLRVRTPLAAPDAIFPDYLATLLGHPVTAGDAYAVYTNGDTAFPAMLDAIGRAQHRISFETYIFDTGAVAERFVTALEAAARRGVRVRMVLDAMGSSNMDEGHIARLEKAGGRIGWYNPASHLEEANYRTHRKSLIIDGDIAFVGGMGIADHWAGATPDGPMWRDPQIEVRGPAAINGEAGFSETWIETGGVVEPDILTHAAGAGAARSIVVWSSPQGGTNELKLLYLFAIASARQTIDVQSPYLITDESTQWSLAEARKRGVKVRFLTEGDITDAKPVKFASRAQYGDLMAMGAEVYEYAPAMMHTKALVVDNVLSIIGSANFDNRSLELNDELNIALFDQAVASRLRQDFEQDLKRSNKLTLEEWRSRPPHIRAREKLWSVFGEIF